MKGLEWLGTSLDDLRAFPRGARVQAGAEIRTVQNGDMPSDFKPMKAVGRGVYEIRIRDEGQAFRVMYIASLGSKVYVLHAFEKKTQQTSKADIDLARKRYREAIEDSRRE